MAVRILRRSQSIFYYAIRLADGSILRLSKDARSIYSIFSQALPMMAGIFIVLLDLVHGGGQSADREADRPH